MRVGFSFGGQSFSVTLEGNPTGRDFLTLLPLDLAIEDYSHNEKIARLPRPLSQRFAVPFGAERAGDLCYYAPWRNLAFFHAGYRYSPGLIRIGRMDGDLAPLLRRGAFELHCQILTEIRAR